MFVICPLKFSYAYFQWIRINGHQTEKFARWPYCCFTFLKKSA